MWPAPLYHLCGRSQCIALFSSHCNLAQHVHSCCFHYSILASTCIDDNVSVFIQYLLSSCKNLVTLTFWEVPLQGIGFNLLPAISSIHMLTFQNCTWDDSALHNLLICCNNTQLLQFSNTPLSPVAVLLLQKVQVLPERPFEKQQALWDPPQVKVTCGRIEFAVSVV